MAENVNKKYCIRLYNPKYSSSVRLNAGGGPIPPPLLPPVEVGRSPDSRRS